MENVEMSLIPSQVQAYEHNYEELRKRREEELRKWLEEELKKKLEEALLPQCPILARPVFETIKSEMSVSLNQIASKARLSARSIAEMYKITGQRLPFPKYFLDDEHVETVDGISLRIRVELTTTAPETSTSVSHADTDLESITVSANDDAAPLDPMYNSQLPSPEASGTLKRPVEPTEDEEDTIVGRPRGPKRPRTSQANKNTQVRLRFHPPHSSLQGLPLPLHRL